MRTVGIVLALAVVACSHHMDCPQGFTECNVGCVDLTSDGANCGNCDYRCPNVWDACRSGRCMMSCPLGTTLCGLQCCSSNQLCVGMSECLLLCSYNSDCLSSGVCAPFTNGSGNPVGPMICKPNDGALYDGCNGTTTCSGSACCVADAAGNRFCATPCIDATTCGAAHCNTYDFSHSTCTGVTMACGP
jgi:hypothetical protein